MDILLTFTGKSGFSDEAIFSDLLAKHNQASEWQTDSPQQAPLRLFSPDRGHCPRLSLLHLRPLFMSPSAAPPLCTSHCYTCLSLQHINTSLTPESQNKQNTLFSPHAIVMFFPPSNIKEVMTHSKPRGQHRVHEFANHSWNFPTRS